MSEKSERKNQGPAKPDSLHSGLKDLEDRMTNFDIFIDLWMEACTVDDVDARRAAMVNIANQWNSLGA